MNETCTRCGQSLSVEQPMTSLGYLLTGALTAIIAAVSWGLAIYYAPVVISWWRS